VALSICGLGLLDETEVETIPRDARPAAGRSAAPARLGPSEIFRLWERQDPTSRDALYAYVKTTFGKRVTALAADELDTVRQWIETRGDGPAPEMATDVA